MLWLSVQEGLTGGVKCCYINMHRGMLCVEAGFHELLVVIVVANGSITGITLAERDPVSRNNEIKSAASDTNSGIPGKVSEDSCLKELGMEISVPDWVFISLFTYGLFHLKHKPRIQYIPYRILKSHPYRSIGLPAVLYEPITVDIIQEVRCCLPKGLCCLKIDLRGDGA